MFRVWGWVRGLGVTVWGRGSGVYRLWGLGCRRLGA